MVNPKDLEEKINRSLAKMSPGSDVTHMFTLPSGVIITSNKTEEEYMEGLEQIQRDRETLDNFEKAYHKINNWRNQFREIIDDSHLPFYVVQHYFEYFQNVAHSFGSDQPLYHNLEPFEDYFEVLISRALFCNLEHLEKLVLSDYSKKEKENFMHHYSIVHFIPELVVIDDVNNLENWYHKVTNFLEFESVEKTKQWMNNILEQGYPVLYAENLKGIIENNIDFDKSLNLLPLFLKHYLTDRFAELGVIINSDLSEEEISKLLESVRFNEKYLDVIPLDTLDINDWITRVEDKLKSYLKDEFGLEEEYTFSVNIRIRDAVKGSKLKDVLEQVLQLEEKGEYNLELFQPGKVHGRKKVGGLRQKVDPVIATKLLIQGLISRKEINVAQAKKLFDNQTLDSARKYIATSHCSPKDFFHLIKDNLKIINGNFDTSLQHKVSQELISTLRQIYFSNENYNEGKFQLLNLVRSVEAISVNTELFDEIVSQMQNYTLMDMFDGSRLMCCAFFSEDREKKEAEAVLYQADPFIGLEQIIPYQNGLPAGDAIGVSILVNCLTENDTSVLLVDSAEGGNILQNIPERTYLPLFMEGIIGSAYDSESELIFVPKKAVNGTAKKFRDYFAKTFGMDNPGKIHLTKRKGDGKINIPLEKRFLEAFQNSEKLSETIEGYFIETERLDYIHRIQKDPFQ